MATTTKRLQKRVNFTKGNEDLYSYLEGIDNVSGYICDLIRQDIVNKGTKKNIVNDDYLTILTKMSELQKSIEDLKESKFILVDESKETATQMTIETEKKPKITKDEVSSMLDFGF